MHGAQARKTGPGLKPAGSKHKNAVMFVFYLVCKDISIFDLIPYFLQNIVIPFIPQPKHISLRGILSDRDDILSGMIYTGFPAGNLLY